MGVYFFVNTVFARDKSFLRHKSTPKQYQKNQQGMETATTAQVPIKDSAMADVEQPCRSESPTGTGGSPSDLSVSTIEIGRAHRRDDSRQCHIRKYIHTIILSTAALMAMTTAAIFFAEALAEPQGQAASLTVSIPKNTPRDDDSNVSRPSKPDDSADDSTDSSGKVQNVQLFDASELASHSDPGTDCWVAYHGVVYDMTEYASLHPGGSLDITDFCGTDATVPYEEIHTVALLSLVKDYLVGFYDVATTAEPVSIPAFTGGSSTMSPIASPTGSPTAANTLITVSPTMSPVANLTAGPTAVIPASTNSPTMSPRANPTVAPLGLPTRSPSPQIITFTLGTAAPTMTMLATSGRAPTTTPTVYIGTSMPTRSTPSPSSPRAITVKPSSSSPTAPPTGTPTATTPLSSPPPTTLQPVFRVATEPPTTSLPATQSPTMRPPTTRVSSSSSSPTTLQQPTSTSTSTSITNIPTATVVILSTTAPSMIIMTASLTDVLAVTSPPIRTSTTNQPTAS